MSKKVVIQSFSKDCCLICYQPGQTTGLMLRGSAEGMVHLFTDLGMSPVNARVSVEYFLERKGQYGFGIHQRQQVEIGKQKMMCKVVLCPACAEKAGFDIGPLDGDGDRPVYVEQEES